MPFGYQCWQEGFPNLDHSETTAKYQTSTCPTSVTQSLPPQPPALLGPLPAALAHHRPGDADADDGAGDSPLPSPLTRTLAQMSILFDCVRRAGPAQAQLLAEILPQVSIFPNILDSWFNMNTVHLKAIVSDVFGSNRPPNYLIWVYHWTLRTLDTGDMFAGFD